MKMKSVENQFLEWLAAHVSSARMSELYLVYADIERFCLERKILHAKLFETTSLSIVREVVKTVESNKAFKFTYKRNWSKMLAAIQFYQQFLREHPELTSSSTTNDFYLSDKATYSRRTLDTVTEDEKGQQLIGNAGIPNGDGLIRYFVANGVEYVDKRPKGGCLWVLGGHKWDKQIAVCKAHGIPFSFREDGGNATDHTAAWWTSSTYDSPIMEKDIVESTSRSDEDEIKKARVDYISWLDRIGYDVATVGAYRSAIMICSDYLVECGQVSTSIFLLNDEASIKSLLYRLKTDKKFEVRFGQKAKTCIAAMNEYLEFRKKTANGYFIVPGYATSLKKEGKSPVTIKASCDIISAMLSYVGVPDVEVNEDDLDDYEGHLKASISKAQLQTHISVIKKYFDFLMEKDYIDENPAECMGGAGKDRISSGGNKAEKKVSTVTLVQPVIHNEMEPRTCIQPVANPTLKTEPTGISALLKDELYSPLCKELEHQGITTVQQLKKVKLWAFMNQFNLYSIATRQLVLTRVENLLHPTITNDDKMLFTLCCGQTEYKGATPSAAFLRFCEDYARQYPLRIRSLIDRKSSVGGSIVIHKTDKTGSFLKLTNPTAYIQDNLTIEEVVDNAIWLCGMCMSMLPDIKMIAPSEQEKAQPIEDSPTNKADLAQEPQSSEHGNQKEEKVSQSQPIISEEDKRIIGRIERCVLEADLDGILYDELRNELGLTMSATKHFVSLPNRVVDVKGKLFHEESFIDWDEGAERLGEIIQKLMQKNNGYISAAQLYDYARAEMNMFLNDNDLNDERSVYDMAQHMFGKNSYYGKHYVFTSKMHISASVDAIGSNFDVFCKYATDQGGVFAYNDLIEYLTGIGIKVGNLRAQLRLYSEPYFFYYDTGVLISAESMQINDEWKAVVNRALNKLFSDVGDHIILREIQPFWFDQLPDLPEGRRWTPLLLQSVLRFYGEEFGARTIIAMESQGMDTLHTMLVQADSSIQNFGDVVIAYLRENGIEQRSFEAEELRGILVNSSMIRGNELIANMPKALGGDERFAWDVEGDHVTIKV